MRKYLLILLLLSFTQSSFADRGIVRMLSEPSSRSSSYSSPSNSVYDQDCNCNRCRAVRARLARGSLDTSYNPNCGCAQCRRVRAIVADIEASDRAQAVKALADKNAAAQAAALQAIAKQEAADRAAEAQAAATAKALADKEAAARRAKALVKPKPLYRTYNLHSMCMMNIHGLIDNSKPKVYRNEYIDSDHSFKIPNNNTKYDSNRYPYDKNGLAWPYGIPYAVMSYDTEIRADYIDNCALSSMPDTTNKDTSLMWLATTYESSENEPNPKEKIELVPSTMTADMYYRDFYIKVTSETASTVVDPKIKSKYLCGYNCTIE